MPVLVTGATGCVGRALLPTLVDAGGQVRVYVRRDVPEYRALGVKVAVGEADHEGRLESALEQVHTLVHLVGGPLPDRDVTVEWLNLTTTEVAIRAAENAEVRRVLFLSPLGADPSSEHPYLAAKGRAEGVVRGATMEHAIFRCSPILGEGSVFNEAIDRGLGGEYRLNPIIVADVAAALVAADTRDAEVRGTWELGGAETMTLDELPGRLGISPHPWRSRRRLHEELRGLYLREAIADSVECAQTFGLHLTKIAER